MNLWYTPEPKPSVPLPPQLEGRSLAQIENLWQYGAISDADVDFYLRAWNSTPGRFTEAYRTDFGSIRQRDL